MIAILDNVYHQTLEALEALLGLPWYYIILDLQQCSKYELQNSYVVSSLK